MDNQTTFWFFTSPPVPLEWIALVVALVAGLTIFQMFFGKPKFKVSYERALGYNLMCWIKNVPPSKFLFWVGVERRIRDVNCMTTIRDVDGAIVSFLPYPTASSKDMRIHVVEIKDNNGRVFTKDQNNQYRGNQLKVGLYMFILEIWDDKDSLKILEEKKHFKVNQNYPFVEWVDKKIK